MLLTEKSPISPESTVSAEEAAARINEALEASDFEMAYSWLEELTQRSPDSAQVHTTAGLVALQLDRQDKAIKHFARALKLSPDDYVTNYNMALSEMRQERYDMALERFRHLRQLTGANADVLNDIGVVWLQKNRLSRALASFSRAMKLNPDHSMARNNAMELCLNNQLIDRALKLLERQERSPRLSLQARVEIDCWLQVLRDPNPSTDRSTLSDVAREN